MEPLGCRVAVDLGAAVKRILVTGSSGYVGRQVVKRLLGDPGVEEVVGLDLKSPRDPPPERGFRFVRGDVRQGSDALWTERGFDTVVHAAWVVRPVHDIAVADEINVEGTRRLWEVSLAAGVEQFVHLSSATVYGFPPPGEQPITEACPHRADDRFAYAKNKRQAEEVLERTMPEGTAGGEARPVVTVLRPSFVVGPGAENPLWTYLRRPWIWLPTGSCALQLVHLDDLAAIVGLVIERRLGGTFNVGAEGALTLERMATWMGRRTWKVPYPAARAFLHWAWNRRLPVAPVPPSALELVRRPWIVSGELLKRRTGFRYRYSSAEAFRDFARAEA